MSDSLRIAIGVLVGLFGAGLLGQALWTFRPELGIAAVGVVLLALAIAVLSVV